jgi:DNA-binding transcriptional ArsR family regulator
MIEPALIPQVAARFKALADPGRLEILAVLQQGEATVGELAEATGRNQPNVSQHLASLAHAGLVGSRRDGHHVIYRIADPFVLRICDVVCTRLNQERDEAQPARKKATRLKTSEVRRA